MSPVAAGRKLVLLLMLILALSVRGTAQPATAAQIRLWRQQMRHANEATPGRENGKYYQRHCHG